MTEWTLEQLKEYADAHGIKYPGNIGEPLLRERVEDHRAAHNQKPLETAPPPDGPPAHDPVATDSHLSGDVSTPPEKKTKPKPPALAKAKTIGKTKKQKEIWLSTPHMMQLTNPETGEVWLDDAGEPLAIPLLVCSPAKEAVKLIKKYESKVEVDEDGLPVTIMSYKPATDQEIDAYLGEMKTKRFFRAKAIKERQLKQAKHFVGVSASEVEKVTGSKIEI